MEWFIFGTAILGTLILGYLWWIKHPYLIDTGDSPGNKRAAWNMHSLSHLVGGFLVSFFLSLISNTPFQAAAETMWFGLLVEVGQAKPKGGGDGYFEAWDLAWDFLGAIAGATLGWGLRNALS